MDWTGRSLALRLTVWFLLLSAVPLTVASVFVGVHAQSAFYDLVGRQQQALARVIASDLAERDAAASAEELQRHMGLVGSRAFVVDSADRVVADTQQDQVGRPLAPWVQPATRAEWRRQPAGFCNDDSGRTFGYASFADKGERLTVVVASERDAAAGPMAELTNSVLLKLAASLLLVALAGGAFIRVTVGVPLRTLTRAAEAVAEGDLGTRVSPERMDDELEGLAVSFNRMAENLACSMADLEASEDRARTMFDSLFDAVLVHDADTGRVFDANPAACTMFGYRLEELRHLCIPDLSAGIAPFDAEHALDRCRRALAGETQVFEWRARQQGGGLFWVEVSLRRARLDGEHRILAVVRDITQRRAAEAALAESRRRLADLFEGTRLCAAMLDCEGQLIYGNEALFTALGGTRETLLGRDWFDLLVDEAERDAGRAEFAAMVCAGSGQVRHEQWLRTLDGRVRLFTWDRTVLRGEDGQVIGTASIGRDETDEREMEERLRQGAKMEAIGRLAGGVAHDFNNLLTTIMGYTEVMLEDPGAHQEDLHEVLRAADRARQLTHQLLAFSRKQMLSPKVLDLNEVITCMDKLLMRVLGEHISVAYALDAAAPLVLVDRAQLEQAYINLVVNARDAMPIAGTLSVGTRARTLDGPHGEPMPGVCLTVSDTGVGMSAEVLGRLFEPFYTTKEVGRGTGLGLSTVHGIVAQSGGTISVESQPGEGSTFTIWLPATEATAEPEQPAEPKRPAGQLDGVVLLVEDDEMTRGVVQSALTRSGLTTLVAGDIDQALALLAERSGGVDLLLTDVILPKASGVEVAHAAQALQPGLRVLFMSGYTDDALGPHGVLEHGVELLEKPFSPSQLVARVGTLLAR